MAERSLIAGSFDPGSYCKKFSMLVSFSISVLLIPVSDTTFSWTSMGALALKARARQSLGRASISL
jgi:hypothetical protein